MKKVLIVIDTMCGGGAERVASRIANALSVDNEVVIFTRSTPDMYQLAENIKVLNFIDPPRILTYRGRGMRFVEPLLEPFNNLYGYWSLSRMLEDIKQKEKPDVTLSLMKRPNIVNAFSKGPGLKVMSERNNPAKKNAAYRRWGNICFRRADRVVFQTDTIRNHYASPIRKKGVVVPNPVLVDGKATGGSKRIVTLGRLHPQKNHAMLIKAFALFSKNHPEHTLHIYGKDSGEEILTPLIESLSLTDKVFIEGFKDPVYSFIVDTEQFVLSSDYEGTPNALLEALMMGFPCVTTDFEGTHELLGEDAPCLVTPVGDEVAFAEAMARLADDAALRETLSTRAVQFAQAFSMENIMPKWRDVLFS